MSEASDFSIGHSARDVPHRLARAVAGWLLIASIFYATAAAALPPHKLPAAESVDVFIAGALPGLLVTLVLWVARPGLSGRRLRRDHGVSLSGAAVVAAVPLMIAGF